MIEADHHLYLFAGTALFAIGFYALVAQAHWLRRILALNVMSGGVFMVFVTLAAQTPGPLPDPVPHAMVLTGIVVSICGTALALVLADQADARAAAPKLNQQGGSGPRSIYAERTTSGRGNPS